MDNLERQIQELQNKLRQTWDMLFIDQKKEELILEKEKMNDPHFWDDRERAVEISKRVEENEREIGEWEKIKKDLEDLSELFDIAKEENDESIMSDLEHRYKRLENEFEKLEFVLLFGEKYDQENAIISIHAGTGGVDAQDWAEILERMLLRFAEKMSWRAELVDRTPGNEAGIKSSVYRISGRWAYGNLKSENGVHRLVRISPFDAEAMRHTSFALVEVVPEMPENEEVDIKDGDLRIDVYKSSGPGGQGVNTTDSAVRIVHIPTKITVTCQTERSQHQNRETALKILKSKLFQIQEEERQKEERRVRGETEKAEWGKQIRSYVMQPYKMVKDHRSEYETQDVDKVLDGDLEGFITAYLKYLRK